jgi:hypothetical protein
MTPAATPVMILKTMRQVLNPSCTICSCTVTSSLINYSNASISILLKEVVAHDIDRIGIEIIKLKESAEEK